MFISQKGYRQWSLWSADPKHKQNKKVETEVK